MTEASVPKLAPHASCTGCAACRNGCPKGAIRMEADSEGFLYPRLTEGCVQCGHCAHICPVLKQRELRGEPACFAVWSEDDELRSLSTGGGAFGEMARYVLEGGGVVFGASLDETLRVRHTAVKNLHDLPQLLGAKPVQSDIGEAYQQARLYLDHGRHVLFSGTPCQVDGLYHYLGEHPERLLTCDVVCGGVSSPGVWEKLVASMAYVKQHRPLRVTFSGKLAGECQHRFRVEFEGGGHYDAPLAKSELGRGIARGLLLRPACHTCPYTSIDRVGDVTLGIVKGAALTQEERRQGVSLLLINSPKGAQAFDKLPLHRRSFRLQDAVEADAALRMPPPIPPERARFFEALSQEPFRQVCNRFLSAMQPRRQSEDKPLKSLLAALRGLGKRGHQ